MPKKRKKASASLHVRVPVAIKRRAESVMEREGLDASSVVRMLYFQIANQDAIPLKFRTMNGYTPEFEQELWRMADDTANMSQPFTIDEAIKHVESL